MIVLCTSHAEVWILLAREHLRARPAFAFWGEQNTGEMEKIVLSCFLSADRWLVSSEGSLKGQRPFLLLYETPNSLKLLC